VRGVNVGAGVLLRENRCAPSRPADLGHLAADEGGTVRDLLVGDRDRDPRVAGDVAGLGAAFLGVDDLVAIDVDPDGVTWGEPSGMIVARWPKFLSRNRAFTVSGSCVMGVLLGVHYTTVSAQVDPGG
jgi:hypothetical protein